MACTAHLFSRGLLAASLRWCNGAALSHSINLTSGGNYSKEFGGIRFTRVAGMCNATFAKPADDIDTKCKKAAKCADCDMKSLRGHFNHLISVMSKVKDGALIVSGDGIVSARGEIVRHGSSDPTDVKSAYVHFHEYGDLATKESLAKESPSYLLLPMMRSVTGTTYQFVCPIVKNESIVRVLAAKESTATVVVEALDVSEPSSENRWDCLWFVDLASSPYHRLYVMPDGTRKLYMAADYRGRVYLTEDEVSCAPCQRQENPQSHWCLYLKDCQNELFMRTLYS